MPGDAEDPCYKGENPQLWAKHVQALNNLHSSVYPCVLEKGVNGNWLRVHQDYPELEGFDPAELQPGYQAMDFMLTEMDKIDSSKAKRDEISAMDVVKSTRKFMDIMKSRVKTRDIYSKLAPQCAEMQTKEYNNSVLVMKIQYQRATGDSKDELEKQILDRFTAYGHSKSKLEGILRDFRASSGALAQKEGVTFSDKFNRNQYINYYQMVKHFTINNKSIKSYLEEQDACWKDCLACLDRDSQSQSNVERVPQSMDPMMSRDMLEESRKRDKQQKFKHKLRMFKDIYEEAESDLSSGTLEELQTSLREITEVQRGLKEMIYDPEIEVSDDWKAFIRNSKQLPRNLTKRITDIQTQRVNETERRRQEVNANIRSLEAVKLLPLTGSEDFIAWKKNQKFLNTHTDPYKKAAALLGTLRNPQDRKMCETIYDFDKLITILNEKYNHSEKLVPALKGKLDKLPVAQTDGAMLESMRTILNVYEQLKEIGARDCFDGSVVASLMRKLPSTKKDFERYKIRRKELENMHANANASLTYDEDGHNLTLQASGKDKMDLNIVDNSPEHRQLFLQFIREEVSVLDYTSDESKPKDEGKCGKCKKPHKYCKCNKPSKLHVYNLEASKVCLICNSKEPHLNKNNKPSSSLGRCPKFREMSIDDKYKEANKHDACFVCLVPGHSKKDCNIKTDCYKCEKSRHHPQLCKEKKTTKVEVNTIDKSLDGAVKREWKRCSTENTHLVVTQVKVLHSHFNTGGPQANVFRMVNVLWDNGAKCNMVSKKLARELGYTGFPANLVISTIAGESPVTSQEHMITIMDNDELFYNIVAYEHEGKGHEGVLPAVCEPISRKFLFNLATKLEIPVSQISNAKGPIDMIIGMQHVKLAPTTFKWIDGENCCLYKTNFGPKPYLIAGPIKDERNGKTHTGYSNQCEVNTFDAFNASYWTGDQLGTNTDPKCSTCLKAPPCKQCKLLNQPISFKEQEDAKVIRNSMNFNLDEHKISVNYPYTKNVDQIFSPENSNKFIAERMAKNLKKSLKGDGLLYTYTDNFLDMEARGAIKELTTHEMEEWEAKGNPINYCSHHAVLKDSKSTACRSVCNSSLSHNNTSLNAMLPKGPTAISNLLHVLMRFRARPYTVIADLKKAYNSISTSEKDCHLRRLLWYRKEDLDNPNAELKTFGMLVMAFGDTPAQYYLECAKEEVSNYIREIMGDPDLAEAIISMSYVDDLAISVETKEEAEIYAAKLPLGFGSYGFKIKEIIIGGHDVDQATELESLLLFGHYYNPNDDKIHLKFKVNFSSKKRSQKTQPNLTSSDDLGNLKMTKRKVMSLLSSQYDPLGLASVFLAKYKIFLARLFKVPEYDWDVSLGTEDQVKAINLVKQMIHAAENSPTFERSNKPEGYKLEKLIIFVDGSTIALQVVIYGLYTCDAKVHTSLITGKNRITLNTVPRNELQAMVAGHRLTLNVLEALNGPVPEVCFLGDSTCTLDSLKEGFVTKDLYTINRISEIRNSAKKMNCEVKYYHIESELNIADKGTREDCSLEFLSSKDWQYGPEFIRDLRNSQATFKMRINGSEDTHSVSCEMNMVDLAKKDTHDKDIWESFLETSKSLKKAIRTICIIKSIFKRKSFAANTTQTVQEMNEAFLFLIKKTQEFSKLETMRTKQLVTFKEGDIIYTQMRFPEHIRTSVFGKDKLPVIQGKSNLARLLLNHAHQEAIAPDKNRVHNGIHQTLVNSRVGMYGTYITYAKQVIKGIVRSCPVCRRDAKKTSDAKMAERHGGFGEIPPDGSCFNKIAMDYFGPFWCKPPKFKETRGTKFYKIYGMAVLCQQSRAVKFYPVEGYDTKSFLTTFEIHCSLHGVPTHVLSDPMTTFISGAKVVGADDVETEAEKSDFEITLERRYNIDWTFIPPGSQWRDPAERSIKSLKTMMQTIFNTEHNKAVLTINEYWSIFSQCSEILNRRPIQGFMHEDTLKFICPNQLLLGRTSKEAPAHTTDDLAARPRLELLQSIKGEFWKHLMDLLAADSRLMKYPCWYSQSREPKPGDVVLVLYKTKVNDNYRIGRIDSVDNNKRDISCQVSPCQDGVLWDLGDGWNKHYKRPAKMEIPVQRTVLLYSPSDEN